MAKAKPAPAEAEDIRPAATDKLLAAVEQLSDDICGLMEVAEQGTLLKQMVDEVRVLVSAIDDIRSEIEWASRNLMQQNFQATVANPVTSMPRDPCDPQWADTVNQFTRAAVAKAEQANTVDANRVDQSSATFESPDESPEYCCTSPQLAWHGDPGYPGVACANCGYVVADEGQLICRGDESDERASEPTQTQRQLWNESD